MYAEAGEDERYRQDAAGTTAERNAGRTLAVVLNWCAEEDTVRCLASLLHECERVPTLDLLLVDSASPDGSGARLAARFPAVPYLALAANLGYAGGNEQAIAWALARGYDFVLIVNDDAELMAGCVGQLLQAMAANPSAGGCAPTVTFGPPHTDLVWWAGGAFVWARAAAGHFFEWVRAVAAKPSHSAMRWIAGRVLCVCGRRGAQLSLAAGRVAAVLGAGGAGASSRAAPRRCPVTLCHSLP